MAKFITTIQLQDANEYDYEILSRELKKKHLKEKNMQPKATPTLQVTRDLLAGKEM